MTKAPTNGQIILYFGPRADQFKKVFEGMGAIGVRYAAGSG